MPDRLIRDVIRQTDFIAVTTGTSVLEVACVMKTKGTSAVLVVNRGKRLAGICSQRDIVINVIAEQLDPESTTVAKVMTEDPQTISDNKPLGHALHLMYEGGFHHMPVVDAAGRPIGLLSVRDVLSSDALQLGEDLIWCEEIRAIL